MAITKNLFVDQGATFTEYVKFIDNTKAAVDLTGYTVAGQMRRSFFSANAVNLTTNIVDAANGNIEISLTASETANLTINRYVYDVEVTSNVRVFRVVEGIVTVNPGVTYG